jgi:hypothetical protein
VKILSRVARQSNLCLLAALLATSPAFAQLFYDGQWDSTLYNASDHPRTILLRIAVEDRDTRLPLSGAEVTAEGNFERATGYGSREPREFKLRAVTGRDGIAVLALSWQDQGGNSVDDIEKIESIEIRRQGYRYEPKRLSFSKLSRWSGDYSKNAWKEMVRDTPDAKYFLPVIGVRFDDYNNTSSNREELFERVRDEDYGEYFRAKEFTSHDFPQYFTTNNPQREAGPFVMLPITFRLESIVEDIRIIEGESRRSSWLQDDEREEGPRNAPPVKDNPGEAETIWERYGDGYISEEQYNNIGRYVTVGMMGSSVLDVFGPPHESSARPNGGSVHWWQSYANSRHSIEVVIGADGSVAKAGQY